MVKTRFYNALIVGGGAGLIPSLARTLDPDAIARTYLMVAEQDRSASTREVEPWPSSETF